MATVKHTPTPWAFIDDPTDGGEPMTIIRDVHGIYAEEVAKVLCDDDDQCRADGQFIVRAVNAHDDLLAACELVASANGYTDAELARRVREAFPAVNAAIAKATK